MSVAKRIREVVDCISDVRCACDVKLALADILTISMCAILAGHEALDDCELPVVFPLKPGLASKFCAV